MPTVDWIGVDLLVAQAAPAAQPISLSQLVIGLVSVVLAVAGIAWKAGRAVATKADLESMATKADLESMATKADLESMATKADLESMATKADLKLMATREDLAVLEAENERAHAGITENVMENRRRIDGISESMQSVARDVAFISGRMHERDVRQDADRGSSPSSL